MAPSGRWRCARPFPIGQARPCSSSRPDSQQGSRARHEQGQPVRFSPPMGPLSPPTPSCSDAQQSHLSLSPPVLSRLVPSRLVSPPRACPFPRSRPRVYEESHRELCAPSIRSLRPISHHGPFPFPAPLEAPPPAQPASCRPGGTWRAQAQAPSARPRPRPRPARHEQGQPPGVRF